MRDLSFLKPDSISEALKMKDEYGERASFIAGGTDLLVGFRDKRAALEAVIDISELGEADFITESDGKVTIGACTTIREILEPDFIREKSSVLHEACEKFGNPIIKNRATLGGNLINASPAADTAPPLLVLGAEAVLASAEGERTLPLEELFLGVKKTCLKSNEMLKEIQFKESNGKKGIFLKVGQRNGPTISVTSLSILAGLEGGRIVDPRIALGSVAPTPIRVRKTEKLLSGEKLLPSLLKEASDAIMKEISPITDVRGSTNYRTRVCGALLTKALEHLS